MAFTLIDEAFLSVLQCDNTLEREKNRFHSAFEIPAVIPDMM